MTVGEAVVGVAVGLVAGAASGLLGVGGGIVMTPGIQVLMGAPPIVALATPLPAIFPTAATGAWTYRRAGELDVRAAWSMVVPGIAGAIAGAALTDVVNTHVLLVATAAILAYQAVAILRGAKRREGSRRPVHVSAYAATGFVAGFVSGLLGIGGGLVMVPVLVGALGMPLKRALHVARGDRGARGSRDDRARVARSHRLGDLRGRHDRVGARRAGRGAHRAAREDEGARDRRRYVPVGRRDRVRGQRGRRGRARMTA